MLKTRSGKNINKPSDIPLHKDLQKTFKDGKNATVKIGFPASNPDTASTDEEGVTALFKATVNNYGLGVPKRPFMHIAFAQNINKYKKIIRSELGAEPQSKVLSFIGSIGEGDVKKTIRNLKSPANSPLTVAIKGSDNPLIDTAHMVGSVTYSVEAKK